LRKAIDQNNGRRKIGSVHLDIFQPDNPVDERLQNFDVFHSIQLQAFSGLAENSFRYFQALARQFENLVLRFEVSAETDEDRDDQPAKEKAEDETSEIFQLRRCPAPERFFRHGTSSIKVAAKHKHRGLPLLEPALCRQRAIVAATSRPAARAKKMITQAFVLGAGLGMRLRPLTEDLPKPLIPIFQKPLVTFVLDHLIALGVRSFVINTHHRPEAFREFFAGGNYRGHPVRLVHEPDILGTGGGIKNAESLLREEHFISYSGDLLTDINLGSLIEEHFRAGNDVTMAVRETKHGADVALEGNRVIDIVTRYGHAGRYDFAGVAVWSRAVFERIPSGQPVSYIPVLAEWIGQGGRIGGVVLNDRKWFNIGSRREYLDAHRLILEKQWKPDFVEVRDWPVRVAPDAQIDPTATLSGFYSIGAGCRVGAGVILENTILWPGAQIASRAHLRNCIVRSHRTAQGELSDTDI
jgi:NDP-sugar pyrophosphorylase family protein